MSSKSVQIPEIGSVRLRKSRRNKFIRLSVNHDGDIKVSMPPWVPFRVGVEFAKTKKKWINDRKPQPVFINHGQQIGKNHIVEFLPANGSNVRTTITNSHIRVHIPAKLDKTNATVQESAQRAAHKALKRQAQRLLPSRVSVLAERYGFSYSDVDIKKLKSRWGSCNDKQELVFNYYLMQLPWDYIDYVILHELCHTRVMSHDASFWSELDAVLPQAGIYKKSIKQFRPVLLPELSENYYQ